MRKKVFVLCFLFLLLLTGCENVPEGTTQEEINFFNQYGGNIAYMKTDDGTVITNANPISINYYIGGLTTNYRDAMIKASTEYSISELSSHIEVMTNTYNTNSRYKVTTSTPPPPPPGGSCSNPIGCDTQVINLRGIANDTIATNKPIYDQYDDSKIVGSTIDFNLTLMWLMTQNERKYIALHELGHTLGLIDVYQDVYKNNTVMYGSYGNNVNAVTQLYKLDTANLLWGYGD